MIFSNDEGVKYAAWYDSEYDEKKRWVYVGGFEVNGRTFSDSGNVANNVEEYYGHLSQFEDRIRSAPGGDDLQDALVERQIYVVGNVAQEGFCVPSLADPLILCRGAQAVKIKRETYKASLSQTIPDGTESVGDLGFVVSLYRKKEPKDYFGRILIGTLISVASFGVASEIGIAFALSEVSTAALTGGITGFSQGLFNGLDVEDALLLAHLSI